jgi:ATP/maltotriose-dependent transcriptional regulator MalT
VTASTEQPRAANRGERRIIERPRLIKLLDESEARIILLLAPAGYGKTTLARQWFKTLNSAIWISLTPAHRDVATFTHDVAGAIGGKKFFADYVGAMTNPQHAAQEIGRELAARVESAGVRWLVLDDWHELANAPELVVLLEELCATTSMRVLVSSRTRPTWATPRRAVYGEIELVGRESLAMTDGEAQLVLGTRADDANILKQAAGWPAVLALAAATRSTPVANVDGPGGLHAYFAEELFNSAGDDFQTELLEFALRNAFSGGERRRAAFIDKAYDMGLLQAGDERLHPLIREFLLAKLSDADDADARVRQAIGEASAEGDWDRAFELAVRFSLSDLFEPLIEESYKPLTESGRLATLADFAFHTNIASSFPPPVVDLVEAELALRDGDLALAASVARRAGQRLGRSHALYSHSAVILGQANVLRSDFQAASLAYRDAEETASTDRDETEATHGFAAAAVFGEAGRDEARRAVSRLRERRTRTPTDLVRYRIMDVARRRFDEGYADELDVEDALRVLHLVDDPRVRTSFLYTCAYAYGLRGEYERASQLFAPLMRDVDEFGLDFVRPYADWIRGAVALGLRRFGEADKLIQRVEESAASTGNAGHRVNGDALRARFLLQAQQTADALAVVAKEPPTAVMPSFRAEFIATRGLAQACAGEKAGAIQAAREASRLSTAVEVRVLNAATRAVLALGGDETDAAAAAWDQAQADGGWDLLLCALRCRPALAEKLVRHDAATRRELEQLFVRSRDRALAKKIGLRPRDPRRVKEVLSPRELEILDLIRRGLRNREIGAALFIAESTTKVHVRHIFEKLGVRTRAEAVARYEAFNDIT